jgi:acyl dehydratase
MFSLKTYWRAMRPKAGLKPGETIQRIETSLKAALPDRKLYDGLLKTWNQQDYGVLPPAYPAVATFMTHLKHLSDPRFPFQAMGTVHIRTLIEQARPIRLDEPVSYKCWVEGHRDVDRGVEFDMITEASVEGQVVSTTKLTMYRRSAVRKRDGVRAPSPVHNHVASQESSWDVRQSTARQYARLSGDINPIHLSTMTAKILGFKGMMLHGMWIVGRTCAMHPVQMMAEGIRVESEFKLPVFLPSNLRYRWWEDEGVLQMRVLEKNGVKPHMIARLSGSSTP